MTAKSVVFETPPPPFAFLNVYFATTVKLVDQHKAKVTGETATLQVTLRYHDTYDVVADQSILHVDAAATHVDPSTGSCQLNVLLRKLTAATDGRAFCLEVRSLEGGLESAFSPAIHVIKEKLQIVQQPPDVWFKDEGGREKCMVVVLVLEPAPGAQIEKRVVPLQLRLLYESGTPVLQQSILRLFPDMRPNMSRGRVSISFRIDDVSKNHQGQSFILEIAPEKQATGQMFQDIAPARTAVIAIRSKRNKRKLNGLTPRNGIASTASTPMGTTPRTGSSAHRVMGMPMMAQTPTGPMGPPLSQRPRHLGTMPMATTPVNNPYVATPHPSSVRVGEMMMVPQHQPVSQSWSSHIQQPSASTPMAPSSAMPMSSPTHMTVEWKLAGFEIHSDGTANVSRPIYRCTQCRRLVDVEIMNHGQDLHSPQCLFVTGTATYAGSMASTSQHQQQAYYSNNTTPRAVYPVSSRATTPRAASTPMASEPEPAPTPTQYQPELTVQTGDDTTGESPKSLAFATSGHRPVLTISPFMNKIVTNDSMDLQPHQQHAMAEDGRDGNLFASNAFRNQMDLSDMQAPSPTTEEKLMFLTKPIDDKSSPQSQDEDQQYMLDNPQSSPESDGQSLIVSVGNSSLYSEMTSMGISVDGYMTKSTAPSVLEPDHPLADFNDLTGSMTEEDQVFYILACMYSTPHAGKLGLPAFDQFQRMLGFYTETQNEVQTQVVFHSIHEVGLTQEEEAQITANFHDELQQNSDAVHSLPKYQHNLVLLREDALMFYWSQSIPSLS